MHRYIQTAVNVFLVVGTAAALVMMTVQSGSMLLAQGLHNLKYFTVLSNILEGVASVIWLVAAAVGVKGRAARIVAQLKFIACVCVGLTFTTVMVFLGPLYGYWEMLKSANLLFHLLLPLAAMAEFVCLNTQRISLANCAAAMLPMLVYGSLYLANILVNGVGDNPYDNDWYGFALWGIPVGIGIFAIICGGTFLLGWLLRTLNRRLHRQIEVGSSDT